MLKKYMKRFSALLMVFTVLLSLCAANAAGTVDLDRKGSIAIVLRESGGEHIPIPNETFTLFRAADAKIVNSNIAYDFTSDFTGCGLNPSAFAEEGFAQHLSAYAADKNLTGLTAAADRNGRAVFKGLPTGLYLAVQSEKSGAYFPTDPFIIALPMADSQGQWIYDIEAGPKTEPLPAEPPPVPETELSVHKTWTGEDKNRPESITVTLLRDGKAYKDAVLSEANGWSCKWTELDAEHIWTAVEKDVPQGYTADYSSEDKKIIINNTFKPAIPGPDELSVLKEWIDEDNLEGFRPGSIRAELRCSGEIYDTVVLSEANGWKYTWKDLPAGTWTVTELDPSEDYEVSYSEDGGVLIITNMSLSLINPNPTPEMHIQPPDMPLINAGQLNWPVPVLAALGLALMAAGLILRSSERRKNEE